MASGLNTHVRKSMKREMVAASQMMFVRRVLREETT